MRCIGPYCYCPEIHSMPTPTVKEQIKKTANGAVLGGIVMAVMGGPVTALAMATLVAANIVVQAALDEDKK